jgi:hypothetical protein
MASEQEIIGNEHALLFEQVRSMKARISVLELRANAADEELTQVRREIKSLTESLEGLIE